MNRINMQVPQIGGTKVTGTIDRDAAYRGQVQVGTPDGMQVAVAPGLSKLEWMAGMVAAGEVAEILDGPTAIVDLAGQILDECHKRSQEGVNSA